MPTTTPNWEIVKPTSGAEPADMYGTLTRLADSVETAMDTLGEWEDYTPVWAGSGGNPTAVNHTITGRYKQIGKTVYFRATVVCGSSGYGTGNYSLTLPVAPAAATGILFVGHVRDDNTSSAYRAGALAGGTTTALLVIDPTTAGNPLRTVTPTVPFTFAVNDQITIWGTYEAA